MRVEILENEKVNENMEYAVLGGGALGLMAAYRLAEAGQAVMVFEQEQTAGGLACGVLRPEHTYSEDQENHQQPHTGQPLQPLTFCALRFHVNQFYASRKTRRGKTAVSGRSSLVQSPS